MHNPRRAIVALAVLLGTAATAAAAPGATPGASAGQPTPSVEITVYAATSLKDALTAIQPICERQTGARLVFNFGASNDLARQIVAANKADVFFSADEGWMNRVADAGLVDATSRRNLLTNRLVVVVPDDSTLSVNSAADLTKPEVKRLSLANPEAVPAGRYAKAWLEKAGVWDKVSEKVIPAVDVRAALAAVEAGAVEAGVVYRTDAAIARRVRVALVVPEDEGPPITYPVAALGDRPHLDRARLLTACFAGHESGDVFGRFGFVVLPTEASDAPGR